MFIEFLLREARGVLLESAGLERLVLESLKGMASHLWHPNDLQCIDGSEPMRNDQEHFFSDIF